MKILICCANGMSSSLLVQKMREEVRQRGLTDIRIGACAHTQYRKYIEEADVLLVAPQLNFIKEELETLNQSQHLKIMYIDPLAYGNLDVQMILDQVLYGEEEAHPIDEDTRLVKWLKQKVVPLANRISSNHALMTITQAFTSILPVTITGSILTLISNIPYTPYMDFLTATGLADLLSLGIDMTTNLFSIYLCFYIAYHYIHIHQEHGHPCGILAIICFLMITGIDNGRIDMKYLGANGIFTAILVALVVGYLYLWFLKNHLYMHLPSKIPQQILHSLNAVIPFFAVILIFIGLTSLTWLLPYGNLHRMIYETIQKALMKYISNNIFSYMLVNLICNGLWFLGLHGGNITSSITTLIYTPLSLENFALYSAGQEPIHIISNAFAKCFISGGVGSMFSLSLIMVFRAKSQKFKALGRIAVSTTFFYINEPLLFGIPIVLNPLFLIPLLLITPSLALLTYVVMSWGIIPIPNGMPLPWTTPPIIYGLLQGGWKLAAWEVLANVLAGMFWYPFFKIADQRELAEENKNRHI